ncbi:TerD family protein [Nocardia implantans]|uniref:TerD family protein n=1 Tax=Nocardia implantans TaxID=3108168 RepID=A0ABU6AMM7_9NOCA|nr:MULTISPECIES: TerD family protein [unclassified Nocardia]MBF6191893.1 TerD family protein [Nocardia beijingensis]MEA3530023.1 TerD family protein [Nocardia sp. CDC192]MEB3508731.1 TerD family protein [Nocardia sp. CDC186]
MIQLQAGQNIPLTGEVVRFSAKAEAALDVSALVVAENLKVFSSDDFVFYNQPATAGVALAADGVTITLTEVRADAKAVLLVVSADPAAPARAGGLGPVTATLSENDGTTAEFAITPSSGETALICLEVYRRGPAWKLRAVGQGYAGGLEVLLTAHGVEVDGAAPEQADGPGTHTMAGPLAGDAQIAAAGAPLEVGHGLERLWMVFEDAARSSAALVSAREYAAKRLDHELSLAVSDPATRNTPAAEQARTAAQQRHDELVATAERNHQRDAEQLMSELAEADRVLPPALASWDSPAWDKPAPSDGIRLGELYALDRGPLRIPYCVPVPLNRPLWIDAESTRAVAPVVGALLARLLATAPQRRTLVDIIDLTDAFGGFTGLLAPVLNGPPITDHADISARLQTLVDAAELAELAYTSGAFTPPAEHRVLLAADFPHGYQSSDAQRIGALITRGELIGLSIVIVGANESDSADTTVAMLSQSCRHLPTIGDTPLFDPWTGSAWQLDLDLLPQEPERQARFLRTM